MCGVADSAIRKYESGTITPKLTMLQKISKALGVSPVKLIFSKEEHNRLLNELKIQEKQYLANANEFQKKYNELNGEEVIGIDEKGNCYVIDPEERRRSALHNYYEVLNEQGQQKTVDYAADLAKNPDYQKKPSQSKIVGEKPSEDKK